MDLQPSRRRLPSPRSSWRFLIAVIAAGLAGCAQPPARTGSAPPPIAGEGGRAIAVTAHPDATRAAVAMLRRGGSAVDAALAAQLVLGLVEPQSSGLGGGAVALHWDAASRRLTSFDALASAPGRATAALDIDVDGRTLRDEDVRYGGRSVGVPGALPLYEELHRRHGRVPWRELFEPAIALAEEGFAVPAYLRRVLAAPSAQRDHPEFASLYFGADGRVLPLGTLVRHPAYAQTLRRIAELGGRAWLESGGARDIVAAAQRGALPSLMTEADFLAYRPRERDPLCRPVLRRTVCVMGPSSFGGLVVLQTLQMLELSTPPGTAWDLDDAEFAHRYVEAARLAMADRLRWVGDPDFVHVPVSGLLSREYLASRAATIDPSRAMGRPRPGLPAVPVADALPSDAAETAQTSQIAIVDGAGNALALTTTINLNFGSRLASAGVVLNNAMTNFDTAPPPGRTRANQMAPGKRAVSSMTPTIVFDESGRPAIVGGAAGGGPIVDYVARALIDMLAGRNPREALGRGHVSVDLDDIVQLERGSGAERLAVPLRAKGHRVGTSTLLSGLGFAMREGERWSGAADPRRDGIALSP